ncbi:30S ribosomal protein S8 [Natranaerofaba carboxydovora]|uniref:30S ribosomal protein S8 n=1 Tax=Natranaerofaba carboxydovora TaxID=2742683 RepID=UPI001F135C9D|nr:30S ribosomal protein S8 [Natranaerofaba carboxydovora]UMZ75407.1 30S ribosomal protein S8 [Natranaerofaba carboxydovora]
MSMSDPIADFLTQIRNANDVYHEKVEIPASNLKTEIARIMKEEGFISDYKYIEDNKQGKLRVYMKYGPNKEKVVSGLKRISKPGLRVYANKDELPKVLGGIGVAVISSSRGLVTDKEARKEGIGGEVLCYIW